MTTFRFRRPDPLPLLCLVLTVALLFGLGIWQLYRLQGKENLLRKIEAAQAEPPRDLTAYPQAFLPQAEWHNVRVTGHFLHDKELYATPRYLHEQMGYAILTPFAFSTPQGLRYVLVNRGWVAPENKEPTGRAAGNPADTVTVEGVIRNSLAKPWGRPDNAPAKNLWFWYELPAMAAHVNLPLYPVYIDAARTLSSAGAPLQNGPQPFAIEINIRNDHLGYAITWFLLGLTAVIMFALAHRVPADTARR